MKVWVRRALLVSSLTAVPAAAVAAGRDIDTVWVIKSVEAPSGVRSVRSGENVLKQPLVPEGLVVLSSAAITTKNGKTTIPTGSRLIKARADVPVYCDVNAHKAGAAEMLLIGSITERTACLIDTNSDGAFDGYFGNKVQFEGFPIARGKYPKTPDPIRPLPYQPADPGQLARDYQVAIQYQGGAAFSGKHLFRVTFEGPKDKSALTQWSAVPGKALPRSTEILGAQLTLIENSGPGIRLRIDRAMPEQPFEVVRALKYR
jgi:hypothetical protein